MEGVREERGFFAGQGIQQRGATHCVLIGGEAVPSSAG